MATDLEYKDCGLFTHFFPVSDDGMTPWKEMATDDGVAAVLSIHAKNVIAQLRKAGYSVKKAKPLDMSIDDILKELEE